MRIAHLTAPAQFGGLERVVAGLASEAARRGHDVMLVLTLEPDAPIPGWASGLASRGVRVEPLHVRSRAYLQERRAVRALLRDHDTQVVHAHGFRCDVVHEGVARGLRLPLVSTAHGFASVNSRGRLYEWLQVRAWKRFDAVVSVSRPLLESLIRAGVPRDRLLLIRNGVVPTDPPVAREEARVSLALPADGVVIGWVGRLSDEKDPLLAVEAFAAISVKGTSLCILGDGPMWNRCKERANELCVGDRVMMRGAIPNAGTLLSAFDVLLLSSRTEGTPMVVLEAAAAVVPVVSTAVGGVPDLLAHERGWLAPAGDPTALGRCIDEVLGDGSAARARAIRLHDFVTRPLLGGDWIEQYLETYRRLAGL